MAFCKKIQPKIKDLLQKLEDKVLMQALDAALNVTSGLKIFLESDVVIKVVELTAFDMDNTLRDNLLDVIDQSIIEVMGAKACRDLPTRDARLQCYREHLKGLAAISKSEAFDSLRKLAVAMVRRLHAKGEGLSFYNAAFEVWYLLKKK